MEFDRTHESFRGRCCIPVDCGARSLRFKKPSTQTPREKLGCNFGFYIFGCHFAILAHMGVYVITRVIIYLAGIIKYKCFSNFQRATLTIKPKKFGFLPP